MPPPNPNTRPRWLQILRALSGSLKLRITLGAVLVLGFGIGTTTLVLVQRAERDLLSAQRERAVGEVTQAAGELARRIALQQQVLLLAASHLDPSQVDDTAALGRFLRRQAPLLDLFSGLYLIDRDGRVRLGLTADGLTEPTLVVADRDYFQRSVRERRAVISASLPSRLTGAPLVVFSQPLDGDAGPLVVLAGVLNLKQRDLLTTLMRPGGADGHSLRMVSDAAGTILAHPDPAMVMQPLAAEPRLGGAARTWEHAGRPIQPAGRRLSEEGALVSVAGVPGPDWLVWWATDEGALLQPLHAARRHALTWAAALVLASSLLLLIALRWLLRPLDQLGRRAERLFDPALTAAEGWPQASGEIGRLAHVLRGVGSERVRLEQANNDLLRQLGSVLQHAPSGIAFTRAQKFELVSAELCRLLGRDEAALLGQPTAIIYDSMADFEALGPKVGAAFAAGEAFVGEIRMRRADGTSFWAELRGRPVDASDSEAGTIWTVTDVSGQVSAREQLEWSASHDALTGLPNRTVFEQRLAKCFQARVERMPAAVVMIDLDRFKPINDRAGHAAGDAMLRAVAAALRSRVRTHDLAVRLGGDEFALLLEHCPHEAALHIAEAVRLAITAIVLEWGEHRLQVGASLGVASLSADTPSVSAWLAAADEACYAAKGAGRDRVMAAPLRPALRVVGGG
jgi:diguanylate cyclase (GGDEF)-like protein/PAS domain S-box-containing protein